MRMENKWFSEQQLDAFAVTRTILCHQTIVDRDTKTESTCQRKLLIPLITGQAAKI